MFSDNTDTPATSVEINFSQYKRDGFWDFPKTTDINITDAKYVLWLVNPTSTNETQIEEGVFILYCIYI